MRPETWYRGKPLPAQRFTRESWHSLNVLYEHDQVNGWDEVALPVDGDKTAILRGRTRW